MSPISSLPAIAALLMVVIVTYLITKCFGAQSTHPGHFAAIDGLRGYLAVFVFLHHASVWYFYLKTARWTVPPSHLYTHLGQSSVAIFFMITGFLFFSKLINSKITGIDWTKLFISRCLRLAPLYLFTMLVFFSVVALLSNGTLNVPYPQLIKGVISWLGFTVLGAPDLNGLPQTAHIVAGVTWSLRYEWFFYLSLPVLALTVRQKAPGPYLMLGLADIIALAVWHPQVYHLLSFLGGIAASFLVRIDAFRAFSAKSTTSLLVLGLVATTVIGFPSAYGVLPLLLISLAFALIAGGNSLFKTLTNPVSRTLGEMTYSIYLLHGVTLFIVFTFIVGVNDAKALSPLAYWGLIVGISPVLILICFCTFHLIEHPAMQSTNAITAWLRLHFFSKEKVTHFKNP